MNQPCLNKGAKALKGLKFSFAWGDLIILIVLTAIDSDFTWDILNNCQSQIEILIYGDSLSILIC
jgi:hypothetical protein